MAARFGLTLLLATSLVGATVGDPSGKFTTSGAPTADRSTGSVLESATEATTYATKSTEPSHPLATEQSSNTPSEKPATVDQPSSLSSNPSIMDQPSTLSSKQSILDQPSTLSSKPSIMDKPSTLSSKLTTVDQPASTSSNPMSMDQSTTLSSKPMSMDQSTTLSSKSTSMDQSSPLSSKPSVTDPSSPLSSKPPAEDQPSTLFSKQTDQSTTTSTTSATSTAGVTTEAPQSGSTEWEEMGDEESDRLVSFVVSEIEKLKVEHRELNECQELNLSTVLSGKKLSGKITKYSITLKVQPMTKGIESCLKQAAHDRTSLHPEICEADVTKGDRGNAEAKTLLRSTCLQVEELQD